MNKWWVGIGYWAWKVSYLELALFLSWLGDGTFGTRLRWKWYKNHFLNAQCVLSASKIFAQLWQVTCHPVPEPNFFMTAYPYHPVLGQIFSGHDSPVMWVQCGLACTLSSKCKIILTQLIAEEHQIAYGYICILQYFRILWFKLIFVI